MWVRGSVRKPGSGSVRSWRILMPGSRASCFSWAHLPARPANKSSIRIRGRRRSGVCLFPLIGSAADHEVDLALAALDAGADRAAMATQGEIHRGLAHREVLHADLVEVLGHHRVREHDL